MNETIFQNVFDLLQDYLPEAWKKAVLFAGYTEGSFRMKFHVMNQNGVYVDCYQLKNCARAQLIRLFMDVHKVLEPSRKQTNGQKPWTVFTMIVDANGKMKTYFDYEDISESAIAYEKAWKEKYLK